MRDAHESQQDPEGPESLVGGIARLLPGQSTVRNVQEVHERSWHGEFEGSYLELGEQLPSLYEISRTGFEHTLELLVEGGHMGGRHSGN